MLYEVITDARAAHVVQQRGLAVIDVAHDRDDRRAATRAYLDKTTGVFSGD